LGGVSKLMGLQVAGDATSEGAVAQEVTHHAQKESACENKAFSLCSLIDFFKNLPLE